MEMKVLLETVCHDHVIAANTVRDVALAVMTKSDYVKKLHDTFHECETPGSDGAQRSGVLAV